MKKVILGTFMYMPVGLLLGSTLISGSLESSLSILLTTPPIFVLIVIFCPLAWIYYFFDRRKKPSLAEPAEQPETSSIPPTPTSEPDTEFYEKALAELDSDERDSGIWAKAYAEADSEEGSRRLYVKLRANSLKQVRQGAEQQSAELDELRKTKIDEAKRRLRAEINKAENESDWLTVYVVIGYGLSVVFVIAGLIESPAIILIALPCMYFGYSKSRELKRKEQEIKEAKSVLTAYSI